MKKILFLLIAVVGISASSCKKETVVGPGAVTILTTTNGWTLDNTNLHAYTADVSVPDLDSYYETNGAVLLYLDYGTGEYEQLPDVFDGVSYRFTYAAGHIYIDAQNADGSTPAADPGLLHIKVVLVQ